MAQLSPSLSSLRITLLEEVELLGLYGFENTFLSGSQLGNCKEMFSKFDFQECGGVNGGGDKLPLLRKKTGRKWKKIKEKMTKKDTVDNEVR